MIWMSGTPPVAAPLRGFTMAPQRPPATPSLSNYRPINERAGQPPRKGPAPPANTGCDGGGGGGRPPKPRRRFGIVRGLVYLCLLLVLVAGGGAGYLLLNPPSDLIRQKLAEQVKAKTGRDLVIAGATSFSFYPSLSVTMKDVSLSAPPGMGGNPLIKMASLDVAVKAMPLFRGEVGVKQLILKKPVVDLRIDKTGQKSWNFAEAPTPVRYAQNGAPAGTATDANEPVVTSEGETGGASKLAHVKDLQLEDVHLEDGTLRYTDERTGKTQEVDALNVKLSLKSLNSPLAANGDLAWQGQKIVFDGKLTNAKTLLEDKPAKLAFHATSAHINASYDGTVAMKDGADLEGQITAKSPSVKGLAQWLGSALPPVAGFGPLSIAGQLKSSGNTTSLSNANLGLDGATATGSASVTTGGVRPLIQANLKLSELDLNKYMTGTAAAGAAKSGETPAPAAPAPKPPAPGTAPKAGDAIEQLLNDKPGAKVHGFTQRAGWSNEPINLTLLGVADADAKLQVGKLIFQDIKVGQSALTVALKNKVMKTTFEDIQLYEGHGKGFMTVDGTGKAANIGANFALDGISALPFLKDAADMDWLAGSTKLGLQLAAQGGSQLQLVETLNGKADFAFANGAIVGFNLPGAIRGISQGKFSGLKKTPAEKTDFSELAASFQISNGIAQSQDLRLTSPLLRVTGAGAAQMPARTVDYTVRPKIVASLEGQQGAADLSGIEIPVRITGPWDKLNYEPDLKGILADPNKALEAAKQIGKQFKGKNAGQIVNELLGKKPADGSAGATGSTGTAIKPKDLLNKFLKPQ